MKEKILFIGRFPPPVHGASKMNELYFKSKIINKNFEVKKIKINRYELIEDMGKFNFKKFLGVFVTLYETIKKLIYFKPDLIYFELAPIGFAFLRDSLYAMLYKIFRKKIIFQIHFPGIYKASSNKIIREYYRFIFKNTKMILLSKLLYSEVKRVIPKRNIYILPNGVEDDLNEKEFLNIIKKSKKNKKPVLLFLANMIEDKGALDVLSICNELKRKKISFECLFVGPWQEKMFERKWKNQLKSFKLERNCKYLGPKYGKEKEKIFAKSHFLIFPTKKESFPLVVLEAFMFGIPVFSYDHGAIKEIISKNFLGFVSKKRSWEELGRELEKRLEKPQEYMKIREYFKKYYTLKTAEKKLVEIFENELKKS